MWLSSLCFTVFADVANGLYLREMKDGGFLRLSCASCIVIMLPLLHRQRQTNKKNRKNQKHEE